MIVLGLTGSIASGKSSLLKMIRTTYRIPTWDADTITHTLLEKDEWVIKQLTDFFPEVIVKGRINRKRLRNLAFNDRDRLYELEDILHPILRAKAIHFISRMRREGHKICVLDAPLLFEADWEDMCTHTLVVYAPDFVQTSRVLKRKLITLGQLKQIADHQLSTHEKLRRANFAINTGASRGFTVRWFRDIMSSLKDNHYASNRFRY